jgi:signal transduction histidine kinase/ActR/RegA family two-component response regulator
MGHSITNIVRMRIRSYLVWMAIGVLIPVIAFSALALRFLQSAEHSAAINGLRESTISLALTVDRELSRAEAKLRTIGVSRALAEGGFAHVHTQASQSSLGDGSYTLLLDANGNEVINTLRPYGEKLPRQESPDAMGALESGQTTVSGVLLGTVARRLVTMVNVPVVAGPQRQPMVLVQVFTTDYFKRIISSMTARLPPGYLIGVIDRNGRFIARSLGGDDMVGRSARPELVEAARKNSIGYIRHLTLEGKEVYDSYSHTELSGWTVVVAAPAETIDAALGSVFQAALAGMLAALLCAVVVAWYFGRKHLSAMKAAAENAARLGSGLQPNELNTGIYEVDRLNDALVDAGVQLSRAQEFRRSALSEREALLAREQLARESAERQNRAKDEFLAMLGHELRNPLAPIQTAAHLLKLPNIAPDKIAYASEVISRQVQHMTRLVGELLDVSRVTRGLVSLRFEPVEMHKVVQGAVEQVHALVDARRHRLIVDVPEQGVWVSGDFTRLVQVTANLLNNAAKYTPEGGEITLSLSLDGSQVIISVTDSGPGIAPDLMPRLFEPFSQGERNQDRSQGGLGLGLALVKNLVGLHQGSVEASNRHDASGAIFSIRLPLINAPGAAPVGSGNSTMSLFPARQGGLTLLVVDDNVDAAEAMAMMLRDATSDTVLMAYDGAGALALAREQRPDVFILDIGLPDMSGYELASRLREDPAFRHALLVAVTGYGQGEDKKRAVEAGFDYHFAKPTDPEVILGILSAARAGLMRTV